jgi:hypothetical protein
MGIADLLILIGCSLVVAVVMFYASRWDSKKGPVFYTTTDERDNSLTLEVSNDVTDEEYQRILTKMTTQLAKMRGKASPGNAPTTK